MDRVSEPWDYEFSPIEVRVYQILREQILSGELPVGERLVERELAERLNISRTPVREALRKLGAEGFIQIVPRKGGVVSQLTGDEIENMFTILESLEVLAVRQASERLREEDLKILDEVDEHDVSSMIEAICKIARNRRLHDMIRSLMDLIRASGRVGREQPGRAGQATHEHHEILTAVRNRNAMAAENWVKTHIQGSIEAYRQVRGNSSSDSL